jgi:hypothetical protein
MQVSAIEVALAQPFTLIQGPPGTGKTVTSTTLVWLLHQTRRAKVLMAAPSNVAVDHLAEKIASTGLKVRRAHACRAAALPARSPVRVRMRAELPLSPSLQLRSQAHMACRSCGCALSARR